MADMKKRRIWLLGLCVLLLLAAGLCLLRLHSLSRSLPSQYAAERWQGTSEQRFAQISCFVPVDETVSLKDVYAFRTSMLNEFHKAALDADGSDGLWKDAWSAMGKVRASGDRGAGDAFCIAVGGDFFAFHPLRLLSGSYISEKDLMKDLVLLDEELAWMLFGGTDLQGMRIEIDGRPFVVGGVIEREQDAASQMAYTAGQGLFMSYDAYVELTEEDSAISCYEAVMAEPVKGFAERVAREHFKLGRGEVMMNTGRFDYGRLMGLWKKADSRSMQSMGLMYPYWENAARVVEDRCSRLLARALLALLIPAVTALVFLVFLGKKAKEGLEDTLLPRAKDSVAEVVRKGQRRRWEKKQGAHER